VKDGVVVRVDHHEHFRALLERFAAGNATGQRGKLAEPALLKAIRDFFFFVFWPGDSCDVDLISDPMSSTDRISGFSTLRLVFVISSCAWPLCPKNPLPPLQIQSWQQLRRHSLECCDCRAPGVQGQVEGTSPEI
jgi:hypothetical protein